MTKNKKKSPKTHERPLLLKDDYTDYAIATKKLGGGRFTLKMNITEKEMIGKICGKLRNGKMKKLHEVDVKSIVLVGIRDYAEGTEKKKKTDTVDIIYVYNQQEARLLVKNGEFIMNSVYEDTDDIIFEKTEGDEEAPVEDINFDEI
jgi:translation initiation factor IF-1